MILVAPDIAPYVSKAPRPGGGGDRSPLPASKGRLPKLAPRQFTPPMAVVNNPNPKLIMEPTLVFPPDANLPNVNMAQYGDPLGRLGPPSSGQAQAAESVRARAGALATGRGPGYGPGEGGGFGGGACTGLAGASRARGDLSRWSRSTPRKLARPSSRGSCALHRSERARTAAESAHHPAARHGPGRKGHRGGDEVALPPGLKDGKPVTVGPGGSQLPASVALRSSLSALRARADPRRWS